MAGKLRTTPRTNPVRRPNPGKSKLPEPSLPSGEQKGGYLRGGDEFTAMPGGPEGKPTLPEPSLPSGEMDGRNNMATRVGQAVGSVGQAVTGQLVPLVTQIAQQNQKKGPRRRQPTQGTLGSSGSLL